MNNNATDSSFIDSEGEDVIKVRAIISCPSGDYKKKFKNEFPRKDLELMVVAFKIFDFMTCSKCCLLYTSPSPRDRTRSRMPSSA